MSPLRASAALLLLLVAADKPPVKVSVQQLLAHPQNFNGKRVEVADFYATSNEESRLNSSKRAAEASDSIEKSIWLEPEIWDPRFHPQPPSPQIADSKRLERHSVRVIGTFHYRRRPANANDHRIPSGSAQFQTSLTFSLCREAT